MNNTATPVLGHLTTLADPLRARMLLVLENQELPVSELCDVLQLPQSTVSRHLKTLASDGWVISRRDGTSRLYSLLADELSPPSRQLWTLVREQMTGTPTAHQDSRRLRHVVEARRAKSAQFFSSAAGQWDRLRDDLFGQTFHVHGLLGLMDDRWTLADLGCGTGRAAEVLAPFVQRIIAVDGSEEMLDAARARLASQTHVELRQGVLEALPLADASVDAAHIGLVLHHVPDPAKALREAARVLRPDGRVVIIDMLPHDRDEYRQQMGHVWLGFSDKQIARHLTSAGFTAPRVLPLPSDPRAKGPSLFVATARREAVPAAPPPLDADRARDAHS